MKRKWSPWRDGKGNRIPRCDARFTFDVPGGTMEVGCSLWAGHGGQHRNHINHDSRNPTTATWTTKEKHGDLDGAGGRGVLS